MPHLTGERLRCDECGAEIVFVHECACTDSRSKHADICCGKEMRSLGVGTETGTMQPEAHPGH